MKAWVVRDEYEEYATVVFAETRNKARLEAMRTDTCEDMEYLQIKPRRFREADSQYRGLREMDWQDSFDRKFLVGYGWSCVEPDYEKCASCYASIFAINIKIISRRKRNEVPLCSKK